MSRITVTNADIGVANGDINTRTLNDLNDRAIPLYFQERDNSQAYFSHPKEDANGILPSENRGNLDLIRRADWAVLPSSFKSGRNNILYDNIVPIHIREYQPRFSSVVNNALFVNNQIGQFINAVENVDERGFWDIVNAYNANPIANSFQAFKTGFEYKLPYLQLQPQNFSTQFGSGDDGRPNIASQISSVIRDRIINNSSAGTGIRDISLAFGSDFVKSIGSAVYPAINPAEARDKFYTGSSPEGYTITMDLLNTVDFETAKFHKELVELWSHQMGMGNLRNPFVGDSPCIYSIEIPNIRWCPACKIDFSYEGVGNLTKIDGMPYPEAYTCTFTVSEFFPALRTVHHHFLKQGEKFHAINTDRTICQQLQQTAGSVASLVSNIVAR